MTSGGTQPVSGEVRIEKGDLPGLMERDVAVAKGAASAGLISETRAKQLLTALSGLRSRGEMVSLAQLLISHQAASPEQVRKLLLDLDFSGLICPNANCGARYNLRDFPPAVIYPCKKCGTPLGFHGLDGAGIDGEEDGTPTEPPTEPTSSNGADTKTSKTDKPRPDAARASGASHRFGMPDVVEEQSSLLESDFDESTLLDTSRLQTLREVTRGVEPDADLRPDEALDLPANQAAAAQAQQIIESGKAATSSSAGDSGAGISGPKTGVIDHATDDIVAGRGSLVYAMRITRGVKAEFDVVGHEISRSLLADADASLHRTPAHIRLGYEGELRLEKDAPTRAHEQRLLVRDRDIRRLVRMRLLQNVDEATNDDLEGLLQEAQIAGQIEHPGVPPVYDVGLDPQNRIYVLEQMVERRITLGTLLTQRRRMNEQDRSATKTRSKTEVRRQKSGRLEMPSTRFLFEVLMRICDTLAFAHARGIQYRNLRPANVVLGNHGEVFVVDWSRAHLRGRPETNAERLILSSQRMPGGRVMALDGTHVPDPQYLPPELVSGDLEAISFATDVHALGALAYEIVAGFPPYTGSDGWAVLAAIRTGRPVPLTRVATARHVPACVRKVIEKALLRDAGQRQEDAGVFRAELREALEESGLFGPPEFRPGLMARVAGFVRRVLFGSGVHDQFTE